MPFRNPRTLLAVFHDIAAILVAWYAAYSLRFNLDVPDFYFTQMTDSLAVAVPIQTLIFWSFGLYRGIWKYASIPDLKKIVLAVGAGTVTIPAMMIMLRYSLGIPRSVFILYPILLLLIMGGDRLLYRAWKEKHLHGLSKGGKPVLVLGAGDAAASLVRSLERSTEWRVIGLLDNDPRKHARMIHGIRVLGPLSDLGAISKRTEVENAIIAMPSASHSERRKALELCSEAGVKALTVPSFDDLIGGKLTVSQIRRVELDDLLGRDPVQLDEGGISELLSGRTVMVTGAGGSIGSELCRQIAKFGPKKLVLFDLSEYFLYNIEQEFSNSFPETPIVCAVGDVKNAARIRQIFEFHHPEVVFHAAAYKHVPLMEDENAWEAVRNNVYGTHVVARAAQESGVNKFVLVSTDKAVNPTNVMGASKRLAELVCQSLQKEGGTRFVMVRFGNVLGSTGSVIPKFKAQIERGGPVTVTHPEITRYFMSIPEAAQLVLQAGLMGQGGEIFVLDMGEPVKIAELARDLIRLSGFNDGDIDIVYTGLRPGEKLYEELLADDEQTLQTPHPKLRIARARRENEAWLSNLLAWLSASETMSDDEVRQELVRRVPEYKPSRR